MIVFKITLCICVHKLGAQGQIRYYNLCVCVCLYTSVSIFACFIQFTRLEKKKKQVLLDFIFLFYVRLTIIQINTITLLTPIRNLVSFLLLDNSKEDD